MATAMLNDFELQRQQRIEENKRRMAEMGINHLASKLQTTTPVAAPPVRTTFARFNNPVFFSFFPSALQGRKSENSETDTARASEERTCASVG
jgi:hypothetical protein